MTQAQEDSANSQLSIRRLIQLLAEEQKLGSIEIAETLWLALHIEPDVVITPTEPAKKATPPPPPPPTPSQTTPSEPSPATKTATEPRINIATGIPQADVLPTKALPVWIADPSMLSDPLAIIRALKPLLQQVETGTGRRLDEPATVDGIARTKLWLPVMLPETEPWFDLVLVVDRASSMQLWQRLIEDLIRTLKRYGAFRDVQVYDLSVDLSNRDDAVRLVSHPLRPGHRPSELIEKRGRRIAIMLSDCAGEYWWNGQLLPMLKDWSAVMPTVVWQMLPEWMWGRTALGRGKGVTLGNGTPGAASQRLQPLPLGLDELSTAERKRSPIPVVTSEPDTLNNWSLMLAGDRRELTPGFLLPMSGGVVPKAKSIEALALEQLRRAGSAEDEAAIAAQINVIAKARIQRFLQLSSPAARRLIMLLAAAPVITLPVMRLIRDAMMDDEAFADAEGFTARSPLPVAEAFLSGLLQRLPEQSPAPNQPEQPQSEAYPSKIDPNLVQYDFVPGVRSLLLKALPEEDTVDVVNSVSAAVEARWNKFSKQDFRTFLLDPSAKAPEGLADMRAFASVTASILRQLGGQYGQLAEQLQRGAAGTRKEQSPESEDDFEIPPLKTLDFFRAEVREETPPVQLVMDEFTIATVEFETEVNVDERLAEIVDIEDESARAAALIALAPQLEGQPFNLLVRVMTVVQAIQNKRARLDVLSAMLPYLPDRLQGQVLDLIGELEEPEGPELSVFEFEVASLVPVKAGWEVYREPQSAYQFIEPLGDAIELEMVAIPAGTFMMGSPESELEHDDDESPQHEVSVTAFFMGRYPMTQAQWRFVAALAQVNVALEADPSRFKGDNRPVEQVSWREAVEFCDRLSRHTGNDYRLPSEAQWEYACRAGTQSPFYFGDTISSELANYQGTTVYNGGPQGEARKETTSVDYFNAENAFGLCDMHGNVLEWCADHWHGNYEGVPVDGSAWITENEDAGRVSRGGSWDNYPRSCRSATRSITWPDDRDFCIGFRVCCFAPRTLQAPAG